MIDWESQLQILSSNFQRDYETFNLHKLLSQLEFDLIFEEYYPKLISLFDKAIIENYEIEIPFLENQFIKADEEFGIDLFAGIFYKRILQNHLDRLIHKNPTRSSKYLNLIEEDLRNLFQLPTLECLIKHINNELILINSSNFGYLIDCDKFTKSQGFYIGDKHQSIIIEICKSLGRNLEDNYSAVAIYNEHMRYNSITAPSTPLERAGYLVDLMYFYDYSKLHFIDLNLVDQVYEFLESQIGLELFVNRLVSQVQTRTMEQNINIYLSLKYHYDINHLNKYSPLLELYDNLRRIWINIPITIDLNNAKLQIRDIINFYLSNNPPGIYDDTDSIGKFFANAIKQKDIKEIETFYKNYDEIPEIEDLIISKCDLSCDQVKDFASSYKCRSPVIEKFIKDLLFKTSINCEELNAPNVLSERLLSGELEIYGSEEIWGNIASKITINYGEYKTLLLQIKENENLSSVEYFKDNICYQVRFKDGVSLLSAMGENFFEGFTNSQICRSLESLFYADYLSIKQVLFNSKEDSVSERLIIFYLSRKFYDLDYFIKYKRRFLSRVNS